MPIAKLHEEGPQALFVTPEENIVNLFNSTLSHLEKVEGLTKNEYI
jgi:hypothetical protein